MWNYAIIQPTDVTAYCNHAQFVETNSEPSLPVGYSCQPRYTRTHTSNGHVTTQSIIESTSHVQKESHMNAYTTWMSIQWIKSNMQHTYGYTQVQHRLGIRRWRCSRWPLRGGLCMNMVGAHYDVMCINIQLTSHTWTARPLGIAYNNTPSRRQAQRGRPDACSCLRGYVCGAPAIGQW